jgi:glycosyltransferase involved in cell wall biosynthesis
LKLCILANDFKEPWDEGGKNNMRAMLARWSKEHDLFVIGLGNSDARHDSEGYPVHLIRSPLYTTRFVRLFYLVGYLRLALKARRIIKQEKPDLFLCYFETASTGFFGWLAKWWSGSKAPLTHAVWSDWYEISAAPIGIWLTEHLPHLLLNNRLASWFSLLFMDKIITTSKHLEERVKRIGFRNVEFTPTGVDTDRFYPRKDLREQFKERLVIGYLGHLSHAKGVSLLLDALLPILEELDARLLFATTEGAEEDSLIASLDHPRVTKFKLVDPCEFFGTCDLSVLPRRRSSGTVSYPNVLLESMACGVPVLTSDLPAIREVIDPGKNGFLFEPNNQDDLQAKTRDLAGNTELVANAGRKARAFVEENMNWDLQSQRAAEAVIGGD